MLFSALLWWERNSPQSSMSSFQLGDSRRPFCNRTFTPHQLRWSGRERHIFYSFFARCAGHLESIFIASALGMYSHWDVSSVPSRFSLNNSLFCFASEMLGGLSAVWKTLALLGWSQDYAWHSCALLGILAFSPPYPTVSFLSVFFLITFFCGPSPTQSHRHTESMLRANRNDITYHPLLATALIARV